MTSSHRRPSVEIFSMLFGIVYSRASTWTGRRSAIIPTRAGFISRITPQDGPAILWYGWVTAAAVVSAAIARVGAASIG